MFCVVICLWTLCEELFVLWGFVCSRVFCVGMVLIKSACFLRT